MLGVGALAGVLGGMLGIGGGIVMIPAMFFVFGGEMGRYGPNGLHVYKLAAISTSFVLSIPAVLRHIRARAIVRRFLPAIIPAAFVGVIGGVLLAGVFRDEQAANLRRIFGGFLELVVLISLVQEWRTARGAPYLRDHCPMPTRRTLLGVVVGLPAGVIAGLLGVGGGIWAVPAQSLLFGLRIRNAIANSAAMIVGISVVTAISLTLFISTRLAGDPHVSTASGWWLTLWLAPGAVAGGWLGASLTHTLPVRWLRYAFLLVLAYTGYQLITR
ncbi:MAG: sulfite exporter TauE/SafE family protein [Planctomycetota bacterium]